MHSLIGIDAGEGVTLDAARRTHGFFLHHLHLQVRPRESIRAAFTLTGIVCVLLWYLQLTHSDCHRVNDDVVSTNSRTNCYETSPPRHAGYTRGGSLQNGMSHLKAPQSSRKLMKMNVG